MLKTIFQQATMMALLTGITAEISHHMGGEHALMTGFTSAATGITALIGGAFTGHRITYKPNITNSGQLGATIGGLLGYAAGSVIGFALKHS